MRQAAMSRGSSSVIATVPNAAVALDSSQRSLAVVSDWASLLGEILLGEL